MENTSLKRLLNKISAVIPFSRLKREIKSEITVTKSKNPTGVDAATATSVGVAFTDVLTSRVSREVYHESSVVSECVDKLAARISALPLSLTPYVKDSFLDHNNPMGDSFRDVIFKSVVDLLVAGKAVLIPVFSANGKLDSFISRDPICFVVKRDKAGVIKYVTQEVGSVTETFKPGEIIIIPFLPRSYTHAAKSVISSLTYEVTILLNNLTNWISRSKGEDSPPLGLLYVNGIGKEQLDTLKTMVENRLSGESPKEVPMAYGVDKAGFIKICDELASDVARALDVCKVAVYRRFGFNDDGKGESTLTLSLVRTLHSHINDFLSNLNSKLTFFYVPTTNLNELGAGVRAGLISTNTSRETLGLPPRPGGDQLSVVSPTGITPISEGVEGTSSNKEESGFGESRSTLDEPDEMEFHQGVEVSEILRSLTLNTERDTRTKILDIKNKLSHLESLFRRDLDKLTSRFLADYTSYTLLRKNVGSEFIPIYSKYANEVDQLFRYYVDSAIAIGKSFPDLYWKPDEYDSVWVERDLSNSRDLILSSVLDDAKSKLIKIKELYEKEKRKTVKLFTKDLNEVVGGIAASLTALSGIITAASFTPLLSVTKYFNMVEHKGLRLRWNCRFERSCIDCISLAGRTFTPQELEVLDLFPKRGVRCRNNCHCWLEVVHGRGDVLEDWLFHSIRPKGIVSDKLNPTDFNHVDRRVVDALNEHPFLREPGFLNSFNRVELSSTISKPIYNAQTGWVRIPAGYTDKQIVDAYLQILSNKILTTYDLSDLANPIVASMGALLRRHRLDALSVAMGKTETELNTFLKGEESFHGVTPGEAEAWLTRGDDTAIKKLLYTPPHPISSYRDINSFLYNALREMTYTPGIFAKREDQAVILEALGNLIWSREAYERYLGRLKRYKHPTWRATSTSRHVLGSIEFDTPTTRSYVENLMKKYPQLSSPEIFGVKMIRHTDGVPSITYVRGDVDNAILRTNFDDFATLHELGHYVFDKHLIRNIPAITAWGAFYSEILDKALATTIDISGKNLVETSKFRNLFLSYLSGYEQHMMDPFACLEFCKKYSPRFLKEVVTPNIRQIRTSWSIPLRPYTAFDLEEAFAEMFALYFTNPSLIQYYNPNWYTWFDQLIQGVVTKSGVKDIRNLITSARRVSTETGKAVTDFLRESVVLASRADSVDILKGTIESLKVLFDGPGNPSFEVSINRLAELYDVPIERIKHIAEAVSKKVKKPRLKTRVERATLIKEVPTSIKESAEEINSLSVELHELIKRHEASPSSELASAVASDVRKLFKTILENPDSLLLGEKTIQVLTEISEFPRLNTYLKKTVANFENRLNYILRNVETTPSYANTRVTLKSYKAAFENGFPKKKLWELSNEFEKTVNRYFSERSSTLAVVLAERVRALADLVARSGLKIDERMKQLLLAVKQDETLMGIMKRIDPNVATNLNSLLS